MGKRETEKERKRVGIGAAPSFFWALIKASNMCTPTRPLALSPGPGPRAPWPPRATSRPLLLLTLHKFNLRPCIVLPGCTAPDAETWINIGVLRAALCLHGARFESRTAHDTTSAFSPTLDFSYRSVVFVRCLLGVFAWIYLQVHSLYCDNT